MVWENVPGAFSSNKGEDFRIVLEETAKVADKAATIPRPEKGKWANSGAVMGDGWSIAWRVFDAQFWGVPQRRRRIALVADFGGESAPEILFERKGVFGDSPPGGTPWEDFTTAIKERFGKADRAERVDGFDVVPLNNSAGQEHAVAYSFDSLSSNSMKSNNPKSGCRQVDVAKTIDTTTPDPSKNQGGNAIVNNSTVRRLTPLECERLQGFPDGWTDIGDYIDTKGKKRKTSDSARYKALGNSIALPSWVWVLERLARCCGSDYTMASLFDGIGGFPLIWETLNGQGTCSWASEIEEFPIAVTKRHFS